MAVGATAATGTACVILLANIIKDKDDHTFIEAPIDFTSFFMAFGTICFAFGGHPAFPTFQADMKNQRNFGKAVLFGYLSKYVLSLSVSVCLDCLSVCLSVSLSLCFATFFCRGWGGGGRMGGGREGGGGKGFQLCLPSILFVVV